MFVYILLNCEYMDYASRNKWYLRNLKACKEYNALLITHEYLYNHFEEIQEELNERLLTTFDIEKISKQDVDDVDQFYIPDSYFDEIDHKHITRTAALNYLYTNREDFLEKTIISAIEANLSKRGERKVDGIFYCLEPYPSIQAVSEYFQAPLIAYTFSAIRAVHGYRDTLYMPNVDGKLNNTDICERAYEEYGKEIKQFNLFSHKELISFLGKERTLPLMSIMHQEPYFDLGICGEGFLINPGVFRNYSATDDDTFYECNKLFDKIDVRQHPIQMTNERFDRTEKRNDAALFILNCKRVTSICSQIMLKVMLWNRTAVMKKNTLDYSFACEHDYNSQGKVDLDFLNFYIFAYMVPSGLMFNLDYWRWRLTRPMWSEMLKKHLEYYIGLGWLNKDIIETHMSNERQRDILKLRGIDENSIDVATSVIDEKVDFAFATSKIYLPSRHKSVWRVNLKNENGFLSSFDSAIALDENSILFYPLDDIGGYVRIREVSVDGRRIEHASCDGKYHFFDKNIGYIEIALEEISRNYKIDVLWEYMSILDYCRKGDMK